MVLVSLCFWNNYRMVVWEKIIKRNFIKLEGETLIKKFDDLITYLIISIIVGGRIGYVFYNFDYYAKTR